MRKLAVVLSTVASVALTGCNPQVVIKSVTLSPTAVNWGAQSYYYSSWECSVPLPGQGFFTNGLGMEVINAGEAPSGTDDIYNQGANPAPCTESMQWLYRGNVQFNLSQFDTITSANLQFGLNRSTGGDAGTANTQTPPQCVATVLGLSTGTRDDGSGPYYWDYDPNTVASMPGPTPPAACQTLISPLFNIGVSQQVRDWLTPAGTPGGGFINNGFILAGPNLGSPGRISDNNSNVSFYNDFHLVIYYNPAQNPRAPQ